jgi:hypothetical protein
MVITALDMSGVKTHDHCKENKEKEVDTSTNLLSIRITKLPMKSVVE